MEDILYERRLDADRAWALREGSDHFGLGGSVQQTLITVARRLDSLSICYALVGGMAMFQHGYRRFTEDVDLLVTAEALAEIHEKLIGLGYVLPFPGATQLRDTATGVRIEFLVTGRFPGDGRPKPVAFPDPAAVSEVLGGIRVLRIEKLMELKIASGASHAGRLKDLADAQEMIRVLGLEEAFADRLDPTVRPKFRELWRGVHPDDGSA